MMMGYNKYERDPNRPLPNIYDVPLSKKEHKVWLEFMKFYKETPELLTIDREYVERGKTPIELDHPLVLVIRDFAVTGFNENWEMHVKKGEKNHIHDFELMECYLVKVYKHYYFLMTIEAMEEGNLGVYEVHVNCHISDGRLTLCKFFLTNRTPFGGMKGKALSQLRSMYKTVEDVERDINIYLKTAHKSFKGKKKEITAAGSIRLKKHHFKAMCMRKLLRISQDYGKKTRRTIAELIRLKKQSNKAIKDAERDRDIYLKTTHISFKDKKKEIMAADSIRLIKLRFKAMCTRKLRRISQAYGGKKKRIVTAELIRFRKHNNKAMKGFSRELSLNTETLVPPSCNPSNRDDWMDPEKYFYSGLVRRRSAAWGYDFKNPSGGPYRTSLLY